MIRLHVAQKKVSKVRRESLSNNNTKLRSFPKQRKKISKKSFEDTPQAYTFVRQERSEESRELLIPRGSHFLSYTTKPSFMSPPRFRMGLGRHNKIEINDHIHIILLY